MTQFNVFWVVTFCSAVAGYQRLEGPCYVHLHSEVHGNEKKVHIYRPGVQDSSVC